MGLCGSKQLTTEEEFTPNVNVIEVGELYKILRGDVKTINSTLPSKIQSIRKLEQIAINAVAKNLKDFPNKADAFKQFLTGRQKKWFETASKWANLSYFEKITAKEAAALTKDVVTMPTDQHYKILVKYLGSNPKRHEVADAIKAKLPAANNLRDPQHHNWFNDALKAMPAVETHDALNPETSKADSDANDKNSNSSERLPESKVQEDQSTLPDALSNVTKKPEKTAFQKMKEGFETGSISNIKQTRKRRVTEHEHVKVGETGEQVVDQLKKKCGFYVENGDSNSEGPSKVPEEKQPQEEGAGTKIRRLAHLDEYEHSSPVALALFLIIFFIIGVVWLRFTRSTREPKKRCRKATANDAQLRNSPELSC